MTSPGMFIVGTLFAIAGVKLWLLQFLASRSEKRREQERREQSPFHPADGHQQTQDLRRRLGL